MEEPREKEKMIACDHLDEYVEPVEGAKAYSGIKRMLAKLDRFLDKRVAGIALFFMFSMLAVGAALISTNAVHASTGGIPERRDVTVMLWAMLGTIAFLFLLVTLRIIVVRRRKLR